jgi:hypothetical protein
VLAVDVAKRAVDLSLREVDAGHGRGNADAKAKLMMGRITAVGERALALRGADALPLRRLAASYGRLPGCR